MHFTSSGEALLVSILEESSIRFLPNCTQQAIGNRCIQTERGANRQQTLANDNAIRITERCGGQLKSSDAYQREVEHHVSVNKPFNCERISRCELNSGFCRTGHHVSRGGDHAVWTDNYPVPLADPSSRSTSIVTTERAISEMVGRGAVDFPGSCSCQGRKF